MTVPVKELMASSRTSLARRSRWLVGSSSSRKLAGLTRILRQRVAVALAAGEDAEGLEDVVAGEEEAAEEAAQFGLRHFWRDAADVGEHLSAGVEDFVLVLREVFGKDVVAELQGAAGGSVLPGKQADEGGLAGSVDADQRDAVAAIDGEADVVEDFLRAVALCRGRRLRRRCGLRAAAAGR